MGTVPAVIPSVRAVLSEDEVIRMERFRFPQDQHRFAICHCNLRQILSGYLDAAPHALEFVAGTRGRPELSGEYVSHLNFNLTHSKTLGVLAVSSTLIVGVDIEDIRPIELDVAERHFSPKEICALRQLEEDDWSAGFFRCWTSKEALLKAEGVGMQIPLDSFDVSIAANEAPALLASRPPSLFRFPWKLYDVTPTLECSATLAVNEAPLEIKRLHFVAS